MKGNKFTAIVRVEKMLEKIGIRIIQIKIKFKIIIIKNFTIMIMISVFWKMILDLREILW
jgi:hypothetical protein